MSPLAPAVLVLERRPCWEAELKRRLCAEGILVRPCRASADVIALARAMPGSVAVIDLGGGPEVALRMLERFRCEPLTVEGIVVAPESLRELEWQARELGAAAFLPETVSGDDLAALCRRLLAPRSTPALR